MNLNLKTLRLIYIISTLLPLLLLLPLSFSGYFRPNSGLIIFGIFFSLVPLGAYIYLSDFSIRKNIQPDEASSTILSITYYLNFSIYMLAILIAFYYLVIGSFLLNGEVPMGMKLDSSHIPFLFGGGLLLILISACGMKYLAETKKFLRSKIPKS